MDRKYVAAKKKYGFLSSLSEVEFNKQFHYWREHLSDLSSFSCIPLDDRNSCSSTNVQDVHPFSLGDEWENKFTCAEFINKYEHIELVLSSLSVLLSGYNSSDEVVIGYRSIGFSGYQNDLVLKFACEKDTAVEDHLRGVGRVYRDALKNGGIPYQFLVENVTGLEDADGQHKILVKHVKSDSDGVDNTADLVIEQPNCMKCVDMILLVVEKPIGIELSWEYSADLFDSAALDRLSAGLSVILNRLVEGGEGILADFLIGSNLDAREQVFSWSGSDLTESLCRTHEMFEQQANRFPGVMAVICGGASLSYGELNKRSNKLAHYLVEEVGGKGGVVGVCIERSIDMIVVILAVMKSGCAYLPMNPNYPKERLQFMLEDSCVDVVVSEASVLCKEVFQEKRIRCIDKDNINLDGFSDENVPANESLHDLAYLIYTSGSTGRPKGVLIEHKALANFIVAMGDRLFSGRNSRGGIWLLISDISFDISVLEMFLPLCYGHTQVVATESDLKDGAELKSLLDSHQVSYMQATPATWKLLKTVSWEGSQDLEVLVGGEYVGEELGKWLVKSAKRVWNCYGPTEATVWSHVRYVGGQGAVEPEKVSDIGGRLGNTQQYVLDNGGALSPIGAVGELALGGVSLARGYLNRDEINREKFIDIDIGENTLRRVYRTGDLVRRREGGNLEFLGRIDNQIKINGHRVEIGEVESVIAALDFVDDCVVAAQEQKEISKILVAYITTKEGFEGQRKKISSIKNILREFLPEHMVPIAFVFLESLPLTENGKIDRLALPLPDRNAFESSEYAEPVSGIEKDLADIWSHILNFERNHIGRGDNFIALGGDSLGITRMLIEIQQKFQVKVSLSSIFKLSTIRELAEHIASLKKECVDSKNVSSGISYASSYQNNGRAPASFSQQRLWLLNEKEGGISSYNLVYTENKTPGFNLKIAEDTLNSLIDRHEPLRTTFEYDGGLWQLAGDYSRLRLVEVDFSDRAEDELDDLVSNFVNAESSRVFDLAGELLLRAYYIHMPKGSGIFFVVLHHIACDGWSMGILLNEFNNLYESYDELKSPNLPQLSFQYSDYARWQNDTISGEELSKLKAYWRNRLDGMPELHQLPLDRPRSSSQSYKGALFKSLINKNTSYKFVSLIKSCDATLYMGLQSAFSILIYRYSGQQDIVLGTAVAGRDHKEFESLVGFLANTIVLRTDLSKDPSFEDLLKRVKNNSILDYDHQLMPFEKLVDEINPERHASYNPLFQIALNLGVDGYATDFVVDSNVVVGRNSSSFDLTLYVLDTEDGLETIWRYATDLFDEKTISRFSESFQTLLEDIIDRPNSNISSLSLLNDKACHSLLTEWTGVARDYGNYLVHEQIERQSKKKPSQIALIYETETITYGELNERANQLAHRLLRMGLKPDTLVGLSVDRSIEMVVGLLGILKAGGGYLAIDPSYPDERIAYILDDSGVKIVVTQMHIGSQLCLGGVKTIVLDDDEELSNESKTDIERKQSGLSKDSLAYVIYTSGSTGNPKGVLIEHGSMYEKVNSVAECYKIDKNDRQILFSSISFDASVTQLISPLIAGACVVIKPDYLTDTRDFMNYINSNRVTLLHTVPQYLDLLLDSEFDRLWREGNLRCVISGGDILNHKIISKWKEKFFSSIDLVNSYGPTEVTVTCCNYHYNNDDASEYGLPIGRPLPNTKTYIVDENMNLSPLGAVGELLVGGPGIARGYLNRKDITKENFIENPFLEVGRNETGLKSNRIYKTGDFARWNNDGNLVYVGRKDNLVKLRGFRIELEEIESRILSTGLVDNCAVIFQVINNEDKGIYAYLVLKDQCENLQLIINSLKSFFPEYMLPLEYITLDNMPLNNNGKIDKKSLPLLNINKDEAVVEARNDLEKYIQTIWKSVLGKNEVGIKDNFFKLGGHSLMATRLAGQIRSAYDIDFTLKHLFESPSIEEQAEVVNFMLEGKSVYLNQSNDSDIVEEILL